MGLVIEARRKIESRAIGAPPMVAELRRKVDEATIPVVIGDMTTASVPGRFSLVLHHTVVPKSGKDWVWEQNNQLVLVAQQRRPNGSIEFQDDYRPIPPHVLWQWIP